MIKTHNLVRNIRSTLIRYKNRQGDEIIAFVDSREKADRAGSRWVVIAPGYAETKKDYLSLSYYLVANGFVVIRFDWTHHLGESEGDMAEASLLKMRSDLEATISYVSDVFSPSKIGLVTSSLATRVGLKLVAEDKRVSLIIGLVGVVDLQSTLSSVYSEDLIARYQSGHRWGKIDILGHELSDNFLGVAIEGGFHDFRTTQEDVRLIDVPIVFFMAEKDVWVRRKQAEQLVRISKNPQSTVSVIPAAMHHVEENPRSAQALIYGVVKACTKHLKKENTKRPEKGPKKPSIRDIVIQNRLEFARIKGLSHITKEGEKSFWNDYLSLFGIIFRSDDYKGLLKDIQEFMGPLKRNIKILDAGCGNGHFGMWLLSKIGSCDDGDKNLLAGAKYVGLDFVSEAVEQARLRHSEMIRMIKGKHRSKAMDCSYVIADLEGRIPLSDSYFDRICCNLVVSYLRDPRAAMRELFRLTKTGGKIVVSSLKPHCDFSIVYRNFIEIAGNQEEIMEARKLLSQTGKIRQKESEGHYRFFSEKELTDLLECSGFSLHSVRRTLGDQANIAVAIKN